MMDAGPTAFQNSTIRRSLTHIYSVENSYVFSDCMGGPFGRHEMPCQTNDFWFGRQCTLMRPVDATERSMEADLLRSISPLHGARLTVKGHALLGAPLCRKPPLSEVAMRTLVI